jgi:hypothetical protein
MLKKYIVKENNIKLNLKEGDIIYIQENIKLNEAIVHDIDSINPILGHRVVKIKYDILGEHDNIADVYFDNDQSIAVHLSIDNENKQNYINYLLDLGAYYEEKEYEYEGEVNRYQVLVQDINDE